jgi:hypothetical protein
VQVAVVKIVDVAVVPHGPVAAVRTMMVVVKRRVALVDFRHVTSFWNAARRRRAGKGRTVWIDSDCRLTI